jgi:hypothetical protein
MWRMFGVRVLVLVSLGGCIVVPDDDDTGLPDPGPGPGSGSGSNESGNCTKLPSMSWRGTQVCYAIGQFAQQVVDELTTIWGTEPSLICAYLPADGRVGPCGLLGANNAIYCGADNSIAWDVDFMNAQFTQFGDFAPVAITAHEWGHRNQALAGLFNPGRSPFQNEQHADCQAGVFAAIAEERGRLNMSDVMEAFASLCSAGGLSGWFDPTSHGTCAERVNAFQHGYTFGKQQLSRLCSTARLQTMLAICAN